MKLPREWPREFWRRAGIAAMFVVPIALLDALISEWIARWPLPDVLGWFAAVGTAAVVASVFSVAALRVPEHPSSSCQGRVTDNLIGGGNPARAWVPVHCPPVRMMLASALIPDWALGCRVMA